MVNKKWSKERANTWYEQQPWLLGCNFIPSTAINQLEMWQAETFDPETIDRELKWAADLGFNSVRTYLHDLLWHQDAAGFKSRIDQYLAIADRHGIRTMFVLFDDCWHDNPQLGQQPDPVPGVHNSGWLKSPGKKAVRDRTQWDRLEGYVKDIVKTYGSDPRVLVWDVYNEPGNDFLLSLGLPKMLSYALLIGKLTKYLALPLASAPLLKEAFSWARQVEPEQPLTVGLWYLKENLHGRLNDLSLELSDVISFHSYFDLESTKTIVNGLKAHDRPLLCTEYLARPFGNRFETILPFFKQEKIAAYNWGLVSGKTQTIFTWEDRGGQTEPEVWYHDIFREDGEPFDLNEVDYIKSLTA